MDSFYEVVYHVAGAQVACLYSLLCLGQETLMTGLRDTISLTTEQRLSGRSRYAMTFCRLFTFNIWMLVR